MDGRGENVTDLGPGEYPAPSPDGRSVACVRIRDFDGDLCVVPLANPGKVRVRSPEPADGAASWRPDGVPAWSPDGTRVAFPVWIENSERGIAVLDLPTDRVTVRGVGDASLLIWSGDGRSVLFRKGVEWDQFGCFRETYYGLFRMDAGTGESTRVGDKLLCTWAIATVPDSPRALVVLTKSGQEPTLSLVDTLSGEETRISVGLSISEGPVWIDPGKRAVLACRDAGEARNLVLVELDHDHGVVRSMACPPGADRALHLCWLPGSSRILGWFQRIEANQIQEDFLSCVDLGAKKAERIGPAHLDLELPQVCPLRR